MKNETPKFNLNDPLNTGDTETQTFGCRCYDPELCLRKGTNVCAFFRDDNICIKPPVSWKKKYKLLKENK